MCAGGPGGEKRVEGLSDSPVNTALFVSNRVTTAGRKQPARTSDWTRYSAGPPVGGSAYRLLPALGKSGQSAQQFLDINRGRGSPTAFFGSKGGEGKVWSLRR